MEQYIYGNIGQQGYAFVSSNKAFFTAPNRNAPLQHLFYYDKSGVHGDLNTGEHQCFWMFSTDLNILGERERLYLQVSGGDPIRDAIYIRGYMSQPEDGFLYGKALIQLLRTRFSGFQETMSTAQSELLEPLTLSDIPIDETIHPAPMDPNLLRRIFMALLEKKKVVLRLPTTGQKAMKQSRDYLLAIYQRMPYELRRFNGFITGISSAKLKDTKIELPGAVRLYLMDADADMTGIRTTPYQTVIDLSDPAQAEPILPDNPLLNMLVQEDMAVLDDFFQFCVNFAENKSGGWPDMTYYLTLLDVFNISRVEFTDERIRLWAANLRFHKATKGFTRKLGEMLAQNLEPWRLKAYFLATLKTFDDLASWGVLDSGELKAYQENRIQDTNAALTLHMAGVLMPIYPEGTQVSLMESLAEHVFELARKVYPGLWEECPTAETKRTLEVLLLEPVTNTQTAALAVELKQRVANLLKSQRERVLKHYENQLRTQRTLGLRAIASWDIRALGTLYLELQKNYLYTELISARDNGSWNEAIASKIVRLFQVAVPRTIEHYQKLRTSLNWYSNFFAQQGGSFSTVQKDNLDKLDSNWERILKLSQRSCSSLKELLDVLEEINRLNLQPELARQMRESFAASLNTHFLSRKDVFDQIERLCCLRKGGQEAELIQSVLKRVPNLNIISENAALEDVQLDLAHLERLETERLLEGLVIFEPWGRTLHAGELRCRLKVYQDYRREKDLPELENPQIRNWLQRNFPSNRALWLAMAQWNPERVVYHLAADKLTTEEVRTLYLNGCSKTILQAGAGDKTSDEWHSAVDSLFPKFIPIPEPAILPPAENEKDDTKWFIPCQAVLFGMAGVVPGSIMLMSGEISSVLAGVLSAIPILTAAGCITTGMILPDATQKRLLRWMGVAQVPGILMAGVALALSLL